jgi:hypothetical protein
MAEVSAIQFDVGVAPSIGELLHMAGHRPARAGRKWICASCPPGKSAAMSVTDEVFFCHRCGVGGNRITLSKDLGLFQKQNWTPKERRQYAKRCEQIERETTRFLTWLTSFRAKQVLKFRIALDFGTHLHRRAHQILSRGGIVDSDTLEGCYRTSREEEHYGEILDCLDDPRRIGDVYHIFRRSRC